MSDSAEIESFAEEQGIGVAAARGLLEYVRAQAGADRFYVFWTAGGGAGAGGASGRQRTLVAFPTPDTALVFAQRNGLSRGADQPRLRRLTLVQLVQAVLREPAILALLIAEESDDPPPASQLPAGVRIERADMLRWLQDAAT